MNDLSSLFLRSQQGAVKSEWVIVDAATAVEVHVSRAIEALILKSGISSTLLGSTLLTAASDEIYKTWTSKFEWLSRGFGISIKGEAFAQDLLTVADCRNAIVHGSGSLTKQQTGGFSKALALRKRLELVLNIETRSVRLVLGSDSVELCIRVCRRFVAEFDDRVIPLCGDIS